MMADFITLVGKRNGKRLMRRAEIIREMTFIRVKRDDAIQEINEAEKQKRIVRVGRKLMIKV
jgi:hypothetical protein